MKVLSEKEAISILEEHNDWRYAVSTSGHIAHKPCFVATTVPTVHKVDADVQLAYFLTKTQWTDQLMITGVGNDVVSLRSLSLCNTLAFSNLGRMEHPRKVHQVQSQSEYIVSVSSIARLEPEFEACLDEAKVFWSKGHYDLAWGRLQLIWYTYGFLWPEEVHIGFRLHLSHDLKSWSDIKNVMAGLRIEAQMYNQHPNWQHRTICRVKLRPMHELFPCDTEKQVGFKDFIYQAISKYTTVVIKNNLFTLIHTETDKTLSAVTNNGRPQQLTVDKSNTEPAKWRLKDLKEDYVFNGSEVTIAYDQTSLCLSIRGNSARLKSEQDAQDGCRWKVRMLQINLNDGPTFFEDLIKSQSCLHQGDYFMLQNGGISLGTTQLAQASQQEESALEKSDCKSFNTASGQPVCIERPKYRRMKCIWQIKLESYKKPPKDKEKERLGALNRLLLECEHEKDAWRASFPRISLVLDKTQTRESWNTSSSDSQFSFETPIQYSTEITVPSAGKSLDDEHPSDSPSTQDAPVHPMDTPGESQPKDKKWRISKGKGPDVNVHRETDLNEMQHLIVCSKPDHTAEDDAAQAKPCFEYVSPAERFRWDIVKSLCRADEVERCLNEPPIKPPKTKKRVLLKAAGQPIRWMKKKLSKKQKVEEKPKDSAKASVKKLLKKCWSLRKSMNII
ncbi:hypothetical protein RMATCC62417_13952 [Rhizopus microsporus]|nr:hypothetical protein RMATCC62417_13952 [Rhizopus microsporus]